MDSRGTAGTTRVLDSGTPSGHGEADAVQGARLSAVLGADGVTTVAWTGFAGGHYVVRARASRPSSVLRAPRRSARRSSC
jgi:hypothetical protein